MQGHSLDQSGLNLVEYEAAPSNFLVLLRGSISQSESSLPHASIAKTTPIWVWNIWNQDYTTADEAIYMKSVKKAEKVKLWILH